MYLPVNPHTTELIKHLQMCIIPRKKKINEMEYSFNNKQLKEINFIIERRRVVNNKLQDKE